MCVLVGVLVDLISGLVWVGGNLSPGEQGEERVEGLKQTVKELEEQRDESEQKAKALARQVDQLEGASEGGRRTVHETCSYYLRLLL